MPPLGSHGIADLVGLDRALTPDERKRLRSAYTPKGYAALPGTGPAGETCGSCEHLVRRRMASTYLKCGLMQAHWTRSSATDIRAGSSACGQWQAAGGVEHSGMPEVRHG